MCHVFAKDKKILKIKNNPCTPKNNNNNDN